MPEFSPLTLILTPAPIGFQVTVDDPRTLGIVLADHLDATGRLLAIADESGEICLILQATEAALRPAVLLPADAISELRTEVARRFLRRLRGYPTPLLPAILQLRAPQKHHLIQLLHTADIIDFGGGAREVAILVLKSEQAHLPSTEWKDSAVRRHAIRLVTGANTFVEKGYLKFLRGQ